MLEYKSRISGTYMWIYAEGELDIYSTMKLGVSINAVYMLL